MRQSLPPPTEDVPLTVIGVVRSAHTEPENTPIQAALNRAGRGTIEIAEPYREGLAGLGGFGYASSSSGSAGSPSPAAPMALPLSRAATWTRSPPRPTTVITGSGPASGPGTSPRRMRWPRSSGPARSGSTATTCSTRRCRSAATSSPHGCGIHAVLAAVAGARNPHLSGPTHPTGRPPLHCSPVTLAPPAHFSRSPCAESDKTPRKSAPSA